MPDEKVDMPSDGADTEMSKTDEIGELSSRRDQDMADGAANTGESGGGAYPNPHTARKMAAFMAARASRAISAKANSAARTLKKRQTLPLKKTDQPLMGELSKSAKIAATLS